MAGMWDGFSSLISFARRRQGRRRLRNVVCHISVEVPGSAVPFPEPCPDASSSGPSVAASVERFLSFIQTTTTRQSYADTLARLTAQAGPGPPPTWSPPTTPP
ncbi:hypothetical protein Ssi02_46710 [Sinosporangium siamense]|uniref:Uncharacterized protein n=1 Tax=Sinosporangium siamense TaxID=1367973 RepID=A0A919V6U5_9ACTN|nr:hypothetical protein Ssi02_46710 [Sinosporangium siamense]